MPSRLEEKRVPPWYSPKVQSHGTHHSSHAEEKKLRSSRGWCSHRSRCASSTPALGSSRRHPDVPHAALFGGYPSSFWQARRPSMEARSGPTTQTHQKSSVSMTAPPLRPRPRPRRDRDPPPAGAMPWSAVPKSPARTLVFVDFEEDAGPPPREDDDAGVPACDPVFCATLMARPSIVVPSYFAAAALASAALAKRIVAAPLLRPEPS
mmetsp:Transcript_16148/g.65260  ORF Transcript_16148/g.65260 Transcript_16148/m.65260 type:complete len:208 (+) Transcript_16148:69-692(+)